ncbi:MAG: HAMP domain-containing histidine kinase [Gammaproteobacteria bacterium]|nr:HAMP domain-containing histidine kinase [Gammaproteobacteria bacterium]
MPAEGQSYLVEQVRQLHRQATGAFVATMAVMAYVAYMLWGVVEHARVYQWAGLIILINLYLTGWIYLINKNGLTENNASRYLLLYQLEAIVHGLAWGLLPFIIAEANDASMKFFAYYVICGMAAGAIATTAMIYHIYLSYMLPMMLPGILYQLFADHVELFDTGAIGLLIIFVLAMLSLAFSHYESVIKSISLAHKNEELVDDLKQAYEDAEQANRSKSRFLANMSHELRTPLNAVIGYSEIIGEEASDKGSADIVRDAGKITTAGRHLLSLIDDILNLSKIEAGKMPLNIDELDIDSMIDGLKPTLKRLAAERDNELVMDVEPGLGKLNTDEYKLRQIIMYLMNNAAKFTKHGKITLRVKKYQQDEKHMIELVVEDSGIGMNPEQMSMLFDAFRQADESTTRKYGGMGMGMAITRSYIDMLGGSIEVSSQENKGSLFRVRLPR